MAKDLPDIEFWCPACQDYVVMKPIKIIKTRTGRYSYVGKCPDHKCLMYRFIRE